MSLFDLSGKKAIVTGGCAGLGRAFTEGLQEAGAEVAIIDISSEVTRIAEEMSRHGARVQGVTGDLSDRLDLERSFQDAVRKLDGRLDILVNNAGIVIRHKAE
jgi:2-deoxy-D-gluconate 3-dehydrogenase